MGHNDEIRDEIEDLYRQYQRNDAKLAEEEMDQLFHLAFRALVERDIYQGQMMLFLHNHINEKVRAVMGERNL